jgi:hypothetical protein
VWTPRMQPGCWGWGRRVHSSVRNPGLSWDGALRTVSAEANLQVSRLDRWTVGPADDRKAACQRWGNPTEPK